MPRYRFEIVRRAFGRFGWNFVKIDQKGRRVLARSERSYRSKNRVRRAIAALREAPTVNLTTEPGPLLLPTTRFQLVPGVLPLVLEESPVEWEPVELAGPQRSRPSEGHREPGGTAVRKRLVKATEQADPDKSGRRAGGTPRQKGTGETREPTDE